MKMEGSTPLIGEDQKTKSFLEMSEEPNTCKQDEAKESLHSLEEKAS